MNRLKFHAEFIESHEEEYSPKYKVIGIYFGEGDPEKGGEHWNFTRSTGNDKNEEVCIVKEIQQKTVYGGIEKIEMNCREFLCRFHNQASKETEIDQLEISYSISPEKWERLAIMAKNVFSGTEYFNIDDAYTV